MVTQNKAGCMFEEVSSLTKDFMNAPKLIFTLKQITLSVHTHAKIRINKLINGALRLVLKCEKFNLSRNE